MRVGNTLIPSCAKYCFQVTREEITAEISSPVQLMRSSAAAAHAGCAPGTGLTWQSSLQEAAHIVHAATERSLIVIDELGKSTSTAGGTLGN
jgi:hypothetical protein